jgi:hypothetical protein
MAAEDVVVHCQGEVSTVDREYGREKILHLMGEAWRPVLFAGLELSLAGDPARERPAEAKARIDVSGRLVRAHVAAETMREAVDLLDARLRHLFERARTRTDDEMLRHRSEAWHHGDMTSPRPPYFPRPADERDVVRHKTFAPTRITPEEAVAEAILMDYDFFLFENADNGTDCVVSRVDGTWQLTCPESAPDEASPVPATGPGAIVRDIDDARGLLDISGDAFVFFIDSSSGRGSVIYRRYDGNYGLIAAKE